MHAVGLESQIIKSQSYNDYFRINYLLVVPSNEKRIQNLQRMQDRQGNVNDSLSI